MRIVATIFFCFGLAISGYTQNFKYDPQPKGVELPVQNVIQIEQDTLGRMWFSTSLGIFYSDGIETYPLPDTIQEEFNNQIAIHRGGDGHMWIYNASGQPKLAKGGYGNWEFIDLGTNISDKLSNKITFQTIGKGNNKKYFLDTGYQLIFWEENGPIGQLDRDMEVFGMMTSANSYDGVDYLEFTKGVFLLNDGRMEKAQLSGIPLPTPPLMMKKNEADGNYYFLGKDYLAKGKEPLVPTEFVAKDFSKDQFFVQDSYDLFFHQKSVFYHFNSQLFKASEKFSFPLMIDLEDELRAYSINSALMDREGILWVGTSRGLVNFNSLVFQNYGLGQTSLMSEEITAIGNIGNGEYLFGFNNGVQKYSRLSVETIFRDSNPEGNPTDRIVNFSNDGKGNVWFSSNWAGVGRYAIGTGKVEFFEPINEDNISSVVAENDTLIITGPQHVYIYPLNEPSSKIYSNDLRSEVLELLGHDYFYLRKTGKLSDGRYMVMKASRLASEKPVHFNEKLMIADGFDFLEVSPDSILLGSQKGLYVLTDQKVKPFELNGKTITRPVFGLLKDSKKRLWVGSDDGVFLIDDNEILHFNERNGLVGNETNRGALLETGSGRIMIGTLKGFSLFFSEEDFPDQGSPNVYYQHLISDNEVILEEKEFPSTQNTLEVKYNAIGFNQARELWVHYKLSSEDNWKVIKDPKTTTIFLPNLPYGDYQIELMASYEGEQSSEIVKSQKFSISKPIYLKLWFIILCVILLIALGILINTFYNQFKTVGVLQTAFAKESKEKEIAEVQFKNVWSSSKDGLILTLDGEKIVTANPSFANLVKKDISELEKSNVVDLFSDRSYFDKYVNSFARKVIKKSSAGLTFENSVPWKTGSVEMEVYSVLIQEDFQGRNLILSVFRDISSKKAIEQKMRDAKEKAEQANRYKTSMLSNISHEIRTPLNGILGGTEHIMMMNQDNPILLSQLDIIQQSGERLLSTINSILDMAKIEANKMQVVYSEADINEFLKSVIAPLKNLALKKGLKLHTEFLQESFKGNIDKRFLEMIINNLVSNAIKYTDQGGINVAVDKKKNNLLISVEDSGVGMSEEFLNKAFQPFEQESTGNDRLYEGTGLGLNITKSLMALLNGEIHIQSVKNSGTLVTLEIPLT
ncbi:sensor histidine kinase [Algoriphagus machipongonensis]|uniref:histidine kinase n=1 Tax=Algoriphagus machipongonensis TaxID=388413 RepID=A3HWP6_9BACT|nr:ATP-binding protein [Algoriphagus machipongonensis]EAZ81019.1 PAS domain-containing protein [Algoriphagus machipongonensis]